MAKAKKNHLERFLMIRNRITDLYRQHGEDIAKSQFLRIPGSIIAEMDFLAKIVDFAKQNDSALFSKYAASLDAVSEANEANVTSDTAEYANQ